MTISHLVKDTNSHLGTLTEGAGAGDSEGVEVRWERR